MGILNSQYFNKMKMFSTIKAKIMVFNDKKSIVWKYKAHEAIHAEMRSKRSGKEDFFTSIAYRLVEAGSTSRTMWTSFVSRKPRLACDSNLINNIWRVCDSPIRIKHKSFLLILLEDALNTCNVKNRCSRLCMLSISKAGQLNTRETSESLILLAWNLMLLQSALLVSA